MNHRRRLVTGLAALLVTLAPACANHGHIRVGTPQVFTRESLVTDRYREQQWLEKQLEREVEPSFQGLRDVRTVQALIVRATAKHDEQEGLEAELEKKKLETDILKAEKERRDARDALRDRGDGSGSQPSTAEPRSARPGDGEPAKPGGSPQTPAPGAGEGNGPEIASAKDLELPDPGDILTTKARPTSLDAFHDAKAYRDGVRSVLRDQMLDDSHDLDGMTLYTLKLDLALFPADPDHLFDWVRIYDADKYAAVRLEIRRSEPEWVTEADLRRIKRRLDRIVAEEAIRLQSRFQSGTLTTRDLDEVFRIGETLLQDSFLIPDLGPELSENVLPLLQSAPRWFDQVPTSAEELRDTKMVDRIQRGIGDAVFHQYSGVLADGPLSKVLQIAKPERSTRHGKTYYLPRVRMKTSDIGKFRAALNSLERGRKVKPRVVSIEPKEYAQNVSDVAAKESILDLAAALEIVQGTSPWSGNGSAQFLRKSRSLLHAIKRRPLLLGFLDGGSRFGWLLGPRFAVEGGSASFRQVATRHSVSITIAVPAWWKSLCLCGSYRWLERDGSLDFSNARSLFTEGGDKSGTGDPCLVVPLPGEPDALITFLLNQSLADARRPTLEPLGSGGQPPVLLNGRRGQVLLIRGQNLWRNPQVFVGNVKADWVEIHSDMGGLLARFATLDVPISEGSKRKRVDLVVVTSTGSDRLVGAVEVRRRPQTAHGKPLARLRSRLLVDGDELVFLYPEDALPADYGLLDLRLRRKGTQDWREIAGPPRFDEGELSYTVKLNAGGETVVEAPEEWEARVYLTGQRGEEPVNVTAGKTAAFVYFATEDQRWFRVMQTTLKFDEDGKPQERLTIAPPPKLSVVRKADPRLDAALTKGKLYARIQPVGEPRRSAHFRLSEDNGLFTIERESLADASVDSWWPKTETRKRQVAIAVRLPDGTFEDYGPAGTFTVSKEQSP